MNDKTTAEYFVCRKHKGEVAVPDVHVHVIGRYPGAPREYWGARVDEWPQAPRGKDAEIERVADRVRAFLRKRCG